MSKHWKWLGRGVLVALALVAGILTVGFMYQRMGLLADREVLTPPDQLTQLTTHRVYVDCSGEGPTVIFINGLGVVAQSWDRIRREVGSRYRTCIYDRAGNGYSDPAMLPRDVEASVRELEELLEATGTRTPVILVAHSYGGLIARVFAHKNPGKVAGIISVDSSHEDMGERFPPEIQTQFKQQLQAFGLVSLLNRFGIGRLVGIHDQFATGLEGEAYERARAHYLTTAHMLAAAAEAKSWPVSAHIARRIEEIPVPMTVIAVDKWPAEMVPSWIAMQQELASRSVRGKYILAAGADHFGILQSKEYAPLVTREILALAEEFWPVR